MPYQSLSPHRFQLRRTGVGIVVLAVVMSLAASPSLAVAKVVTAQPRLVTGLAGDLMLGGTTRPEPGVGSGEARPTVLSALRTPSERLPLYPLVPPRPNLISALGSESPSPHISSTLTTDSCATCHRGHSSERLMLLADAAPQSDLCFTCHNGAGSTLNVEADFTSPYAHPATVDASHTPGATDEFGGRLERHATCTDCHDAHRADGTLASASGAGWTASGAIVGAAGVAVVNRAAGVAPTYSLIKGLSFEYQLCLKCHSGWTELPAQDPAHPSSWALDKGIELNPANGSFHPIEAAGTNGTAAMAASLAGGTLWQFAVGDTIRCANCHGNPSSAVAGTAPGARISAHGSSERGLLIAPYRDRLLKLAGVAYQGTDFALCYLCHSQQPFVATATGATNFDLHATHLRGIGSKGSGGTDIDVAGDGQGNAICAECHFRLHSTALAVKPGDKSNARLVNFAPNVLPRAGVLAWTGVGTGTCTLTCHGVSHRAAGYEPAAVQNAALGVDARITIQASGTTQVGQAQVLTVTIEKNEGTGAGWLPAQGIAVTGSESGSGAISGGTCQSTTTNSAGRCTIIVDSVVAGTSSVDASATVDVEGVVGPVSVVVDTAGHGAHDISNLATWVDARISVEPGGANKVGGSHEFTVTVEKNLGHGGGWVGAAGIVVAVTDGGVGSVDADASTCDDATTDSSGQCLAVVTSSVAGSTTVGASATVTVSGVSIDVSTAGSGAHVVDNVAAWVDARITIAASGTNLVGEAHTFTVTVEKNSGSGWAAASGVAVNPFEQGIGDIVGGTCNNSAPDTDVLGQCTIIVNSPAAGTSTVDAAATVTVLGVPIAVSTSGYGAHDVSNTKTWVSP